MGALAIADEFFANLQQAAVGGAVEIYKDALVIGQEERYRSAFLNLADPKVLLTDRWVRDAPRGPDSVHRLDKVLLCGMGYRFQGGTYLTIGPGWPRYLDTTLNEYFYYAEADRLQKEAAAELVGQIFHLFHPHMRVYGHFLTEGLYKLALLEDLARRGLRIPLYLSEGSPRFMLDYVDIVAPNVEVLRVAPNHGIYAEHVYDFAFHAMYVWPRSSVQLIRHLASKYRRGHPLRKVYVSRKGLVSATGFRYMSNEDEVEALVRAIGFEVINPSKLHAKEQIELFSECSVIVGEYGSGMHNAIFSDAGTKVVCLNHVNLVQQAIGRNFGHEVTFIMPISGQPVIAPTAGHTQHGYEVDLELLKATLEVV